MMKAAILVGCGSYDDEDIVDLQAAHNDAESLSHTLIDVCGVQADNVFKIISNRTESRPNPTRAEILRTIAKGPQIARRYQIDTLFFMFSGHGCHSGLTGKEYLVLKDTVYGALEDTALEYDLLVRYLREWKARHTVIFLDACRSYIEAAKAVHGAAINDVDANAVCPEGMITFCSCSPGEHSYESGDLGNGLFTASLLRAFSSLGRCATIYELDRFLVQDVPLLSKTHKKPLQTPYTRVEPLAAQGLMLVSNASLSAWKRDLPLGPEIRTGATREGRPEAWPGMIAIDFGTSTSVAAVITNSVNDLLLVRDDNGSVLLPSVVHFQRDLSYVIGQEASRRCKIDPGNAITHCKRDLGSSTTHNIYGRSIFAESAASLVIGSIKKSAEIYTGTETKAVLASFPANFTAMQINRLAEAYRLAGFETIRLMPEPCAAALAVFKEIPNEESNVLVVDLGGGTLDVAIVWTQLDSPDSVFEVRYVDGDRFLGGLDYDTALAELILQKAKKLRPGVHLHLEPAIVAVEAERAKILLARYDIVPVMLGTVETDAGNHVEITLTVCRDEARECFKSLDNRLMGIVQRAFEYFEKKKWQGQRLDALLLAGQGTRVFTVAETLRKTFENTLILDQYQDCAVARGLGAYLATLRGENKTEGSSVLLLATVLKSYGIKCIRAKDFADAPDFEDTFVINSDSKKNVDICYIVEHHDIIPTRRSEKFTLTPGKGDITLELVEKFPAHDEVSIVECWTISESVASETGIVITIDIDHQETIVVRIAHVATEEGGLGEEECFQINNFHADNLGFLPADEADVGAIRAIHGARRLWKKDKDQD